MMPPCRWILPGLLIAFCFSSCFGISRSGGIVRFDNGAAITGHGRFTVGKLPPSWKGPKIQLRQLVYENDVIGATIVTDALCGPKFDDAPLPKLARELFRRLGRPGFDEERSFILDGRTALGLQGFGDLDGIPIRMEVVVMKKDFCLYDFAYFAPPATYRQGVGDFEEYVHGFRTR